MEYILPTILGILIALWIRDVEIPRWKDKQEAKQRRADKEKK